MLNIMLNIFGSEGDEPFKGERIIPNSAIDYRPHINISGTFSGSEIIKGRRTKVKERKDDDQKKDGPRTMIQERRRR